MMCSTLASNLWLNSGMTLMVGNWHNAKKKSVEKARDEFLKASFNSWCKNNAWNNKRRFSLLVSSCSHCSGRGMEHVQLTHDTLGNECKAAQAYFFGGRFVKDRFVYRQIFVVRSYEVGPDKTITIETLMNFLQETGLNHCSSCWRSGDNFGATHEMDHRKLIWVLTRIQVQVERYSKRGDAIEVDTWFNTVGRNGLRTDWIIRDRYTKEIIAKATGICAMMNRETRKLSKIPEEVRQELAPFCFNNLAYATEEIDHQKILKLTDATAERFRSGIVPSWNDMDVNQHVNNVKYIKWILESVSGEAIEDYTMRSMTLEFRRECKQSDYLESMTSGSYGRVIGASNGNNSILQYVHLLRLQHNQAELVRARTEWHLKQKHQLYGQT